MTYQLHKKEQPKSNDHQITSQISFTQLNDKFNKIKKHSINRLIINISQISKESKSLLNWAHIYMNIPYTI